MTGVPGIVITGISGRMGAGDQNVSRAAGGAVDTLSPTAYIAPHSVRAASHAPPYRNTVLSGHDPSEIDAPILWEFHRGALQVGKGRRRLLRLVYCLVRFGQCAFQASRAQRSGRWDMTIRD